jgi:uncharacterized repeat protein (TIGR03803 family)
LTPPAGAGEAWTESVLYSFTSGPGGYFPAEPPVIGEGGAIYGTTSYGGGGNLGTVFRLNPPSSPGGTWTETVLYSFGGNGEVSSSPLIVRNGKVYGTRAIAAGAGNKGGSVFELQPPTAPGSPWTAVVLHEFTGAEEPCGTLVMDKTGALYGTTNRGLGLRGVEGSVYRIRP